MAPFKILLKYSDFYFVGAGATFYLNWHESFPSFLPSLSQVNGWVNFYFYCGTQLGATGPRIKEQFLFVGGDRMFSE